ncbi:MAG: HDOD domain-containing protein [Nannocystaceae bacterium]|nr:HDOD domain-containing protein [Nannocystaceae bacterium]
MSLTVRLPSPPQALSRVIQAASDPSVPLTVLSRIVASDPSLSVQLLRMVNSSMYRRGTRISTVERAVAILGNRSLRNLALCVAVQNCVRGGLGQFDLERFWEDSLRRAVAARLLAAKFPQHEIDPVEAFTFGLLQDLGVIALVQTYVDRSGDWARARGRTGQDRHREEAKIFGRAHDDVADELIAAWTLPPELAMPMRFHHHPARAPAEHRARCMLAGQAELLADVLTCDDKRPALGAARAGMGREAGLDADTVDALIGELATSVDEVAHDLGFRVGRQPTMEEILASANAGLVELNMSYEEVVRRLERALAETEVLSRQLAARNRELEQLSITDALTGLPNRRALSGRLSYELERAAKSGLPVAFAIGDLDRFKTVNDTHGHDFGDAVLRATARAMQGVAAEGELVARLGGEEFGVVLAGLDPERARARAEALRGAVGAIELPCPDGSHRRFTISVGLAWIVGPGTAPVDVDAVAAQLYKSADRALYEAKHQGRDRVCVAPAALPWAAAPARAA